MNEKEDAFEARRAARQKKIKKRRRKRIFVFSLFLILAVGVVLCLTVLFPIKKVTVSGSKLYSEQDIITVLNAKGKNLFMIDQDELLEQTRARMPFIDSLKISRSLPDSISVTVKDAEEYCYYTQGNKYFSVSRKGYCLNEYSEPPQNLFEIKVSKSECKLGQAVKNKSRSEDKLIKKLIDGLDKNGFTINSIDVSNIASIKVRVEGRFDVDFGTGSYLEKKLMHLKSMTENIEENRAGEINLSMWSPQKSEGTFIEKN